MRTLFRDKLKFLYQLVSGSELYNKYYLFGLVVQKGTPIIAIPLLIYVFGVTAYAEFVLFYTVLQGYANLSSLAIPQVLILFWYRVDQRTLSSAIVGLIAVVALLSIAPVSPLLWQLHKFLKILLPFSEFLLWIAICALLTNYQAFAVSLVRVNGGQVRFFYSAIIGASVFIALVILARLFGIDSSRVLIAIHAVTLFVSIAFLIGGDFRTVFGRHGESIRDLWRPLLRQSAPLCFYSCIALYSMGIDKWLIRATMNAGIFTQYVIDSQFAYAIILVPVAIGFQAGPRLAMLVSKRDFAAVNEFELRASKFIFVGSLSMAAAIMMYCTLSGVNLSYGFLILVAGYLLEGQYMVKTIRLMTELRSGGLAFIGIVGAIVLTAILGYVCFLGLTWAVYFCVPLYSAILYLLASLLVRRIDYSRIKV